MEAIIIFPFEKEAPVVPIFQNTKTGSNCREVPTARIDLSLSLRALHLYRDQLKKAIKDCSSWKFLRTKSNLELLESHKELLDKVNQQILTMEGLPNVR